MSLIKPFLPHATEVHLRRATLLSKVNPLDRYRSVTTIGPESLNNKKSLILLASLTGFEPVLMP
jgi:hypothetical protein